MAFFTSKKEKKYWLYAVLVWLAIYSTLVFGPELLQIISNDQAGVILFFLGLILTGVTILVHGLATKPSDIELAVGFGLVAVYMLFLVRLGHQERSHMLEYSVLSIFIHKALIERHAHTGKMLKPAIWAIAITLFIGVVDECAQLFIPNRVFDQIDILFNSLAALIAIGGSLIIYWARNLIQKI